MEEGGTATHLRVVGGGDDLTIDCDELTEARPSCIPPYTLRAEVIGSCGCGRG